MKGALGHVYALSGRRGDALKVADELSAPGQDVSVTSYLVAVIYAGLGEKERAFDWLARAYRERAIFMGLRLKTDPKLDRLRADPRFAELLHRTGLDKER